MTGAVPLAFSTQNVSGKFILNRKLSDSDDINKILQLQGIGWLLRKIINFASITAEFKHRKDDDGVEHLTIEEYTTTGGISTGTEHRILSWTEIEHGDFLFGPMLIRARRCKAEDVEEEFLTKGWTNETYEHGLILTIIRSDIGKGAIEWTVNEVWGVEEIEGERRYTRRVVFTGPGPQCQLIRTRLVYDYVL